MHLFLLGVSHRTAPVDMRERLDFSSRGVKVAVSRLAATAPAGEAAVLSTCNRSELYVVAEDVDEARRGLRRFFADFHEIDPVELDPHFFEAIDADAARHLFRVAAGLDSLVVGEPQILGQVKEAYSAATEMKSAGALLTKLFHWSFNVGKRVRSETALAEGAVSVSYAAVALARKIFGDLAGRSVLVIGAGEMGKLTAMHLKTHGIQRMTITSRTSAHANALAEAIGGDAVPWTMMTAALQTADIVITATGSELPILSRAHLEATMRARRRQPLFLIDIAVPRDVEASAGEIDQVFLYNIDDLQSIVQENLSKRAAEVSRAEAIVAQEVERFAGWMRSRGVIPTVVALRERFERIRQSELRRLEPKLAGLPPEARQRVDEITRLLVEKLLLTPTEQLKSLGDPDTVVAYSDALSRLFSLAADDAAGTPADDEGSVPERRANMQAAKRG
jgi:glutamyl-tRNA reductase